jgi:hypothetical protein
LPSRPLPEPDWRFACGRRRRLSREGRAPRRKRGARSRPALEARAQEPYTLCVAPSLACSGRSRSSQSARQRASQRAAYTLPLHASALRNAAPGGFAFRAFAQRASVPSALPPCASISSPSRFASPATRPQRPTRRARLPPRTRPDPLDTYLANVTVCAPAFRHVSWGLRRKLGARDRGRPNRRAGGRASRCVHSFSVSHLVFAWREIERAQALHCDEEAVVLASLGVPARTTAGILVALAVCCCVTPRRFSPHHSSSLPTSLTPTRMHATCSIARSEFCQLRRQPSAHLRRRTRLARSAFVWWSTRL